MERIAAIIVAPTTFYRTNLQGSLQATTAFSRDFQDFRADAAIRSLGTTWLTGSDQGEFATAFADQSGEIHRVEISGVTPQMRVLAAAAEGDRFELYGRAQNTVYGLERESSSWIVLGENLRSDTFVEYELLQRLGDGALLVANREGIYRVEAAVHEELSRSITGLNYLPRLGFLAASSSEIFVRDATSESWSSLGEFGGSGSIIRWVEPYPGGFLTARYPAQAQQVIIETGKRCEEQTLADATGLPKKMVRLAYGWVMAGLANNGRNFIATFAERDY